MELASEKPGMVFDLDHFNQLAGSGSCRYRNRGEVFRLFCRQGVSKIRYRARQAVGNLDDDQQGYDQQWNRKRNLFLVGFEQLGFAHFVESEIH